MINNEYILIGSIIWNGILKAKDLAKARVIWKLGNGKEIQFWFDNWLFQGPLINTPIFENCANVCIRQFGLKVRNYRTG